MNRFNIINRIGDKYCINGRFALWVGIIYLAQFIWKHIKDKPVMTITVKKKKADSRKRGSFTGSFLGKR